MPPALLIPYSELLRGSSLAELLEQALHLQTSGQAGLWPEPSGSHPAAAPPLLRLDSPGGSFEMEQALITLGAPDAGDQDDSLHPFGHHPDPHPLSLQAAGRLKDMPGVLHHPSQWFRGYCRLLARLQREAAELLPEARWQNHPGDIAAMTDKRRTQQILAESGVPVPRPLGGGHPPSDYASLRELMITERMHRVFIKLACGSAASGVIAYQINPATGAEIAVTTIGVEQYITRPPVYYNSGKLRRYTDSAVLSGIINWLYSHGAYAEQWIPKPGAARSFVRHPPACRAWRSLPFRCPGQHHAHYEPASAQPADVSGRSRAHGRGAGAGTAYSCAGPCRLPRSAVAGIDILVSSGSSRRTYAADVNPFGDLLYDVEYDGCGTYEWEMKKLNAIANHE